MRTRLLPLFAAALLAAPSAALPPSARRPSAFAVRQTLAGSTSGRSHRRGPSVVAFAAGMTAEEISVSLFADGDVRPIILFDGVCNLCNGGVNFALDNDEVGNFRFAALQSEAGRALLSSHGKAADDISSIVLITPERAHFKVEINCCLLYLLIPS
mmetsp:Transcript_17605/g.35063  ORF Transcript_17605/g.35063 Transcript_17605/m.35063 type:complete len:156 (+) Transcript_17605:158-625(+)